MQGPTDKDKNIPQLGRQRLNNETLKQSSHIPKVQETSHGDFRVVVLARCTRMTNASTQFGD